MINNMASIIDEVATQIALVEDRQIDDFLTTHFASKESAVLALKSGEFYLVRQVNNEASVELKDEGILTVKPGNVKFVLYKKVAEEDK